MEVEGMKFARLGRNTRRMSVGCRDNVKDAFAKPCLSAELKGWWECSEPSIGGRPDWSRCACCSGLGTGVGSDEGWLAHPRKLCCRCSSRSITTVSFCCPSTSWLCIRRFVSFYKKTGKRPPPRRGPFAVFSSLFCIALRTMIDIFSGNSY